jgi:hypothetical protein
MNQLVKLIKDLIARKFYGKIIISFEGGRISPIVRKEETVKI